MRLRRASDLRQTLAEVGVRASLGVAKAVVAWGDAETPLIVIGEKELGR